MISNKKNNEAIKPQLGTEFSYIIDGGSVSGSTAAEAFLIEYIAFLWLFEIEIFGTPPIPS